MDNPLGPLGSHLNPFVLPDTPKRPKLKIFGGPPSTINENTRVRSSNSANLEAVRSRITTLEGNALQSSTSSRRSGSSSSASRQDGPRPRHAILALEASLLELCTARSAGPAYHIPARGMRTLDLCKLGVGTKLAIRVSPTLLMALDQAPAREHHKCGICHAVKSHPVSYECGHGHCYVCIRMWLERSWKCPECLAVMYRAPFRVFAEEAWIADAYPNWHDTSKVNYNWDGLVFPKKPETFIVGDDE
ncbi:hypothetical protein B0H13DRAFT_2376037 [Mycena leptocephala]|nr:hypothetical protein B0H13DRAFT_2376037 [Mycena leptocephala]